MECSLAIKGIASAKVIQDIEGAFLKLTGMEFSFIDLKGKPLISAKKKDPGFLELVNKTCAVIANSKKPHICEYNKSHLAFIPIIIEDKAIGVVLMSPPKGSEALPGVKKEQVKSAADLLAVLINYIFKHEFDFLVVSESDKQFSRNQEAVLG
jgi:hypothetical protein